MVTAWNECREKKLGKYFDRQEQLNWRNKQLKSILSVANLNFHCKYTLELRRETNSKKKSNWIWIQVAQMPEPMELNLQLFHISKVTSIRRVKSSKVFLSHRTTYKWKFFSTLKGKLLWEESWIEKIKFANKMTLVSLVRHLIVWGEEDFFSSGRMICLFHLHHQRKPRSNGQCEGPRKKSKTNIEKERKVTQGCGEWSEERHSDADK